MVKSTISLANICPSTTDNHYQSLENHFLQIFPHRWHWIECLTGGQWRTETRYPIKDAVLLDKWLDPYQTVGVRFGGSTAYAMLDIDRGSPYHPANGGKPSDFLQPLEAIGIVRSLAVRSSDSGGLHVYLPLPQSVPTFKLACLLRQTLQEAGFTVKGGWLEIFPNPKAWGGIGRITNYNGHRLPLQKGSFLLDESFNPYSSSLEEFLNKWELAANYQDIELLQKKLKKAKNNRYQSSSLYSGDAAKWRQHLEQSLRRGFTGKSQTNEIRLYCLQQGVVFLNKAGKALAEWMFQTIKSLPGFNEYCSHKTDLYQRCLDTVAWNDRHQVYTPYCSHPERENINEKMKELEMGMNSANLSRKASSQDRIKSTVAKLKGTPFRTKLSILEAVKAKSKELFGVAPSNQTLYRNEDLWMPLLEKQEESETPEPEPEPEPLPTPPETSESSETQTEQDISDPPLYEGFVAQSKNSSEILYSAPPCNWPEPQLPVTPQERSQRRQKKIQSGIADLVGRLRQKFTAGGLAPTEPEPCKHPEEKSQVF